MAESFAMHSHRQKTIRTAQSANQFPFVTEVSDGSLYCSHAQGHAMGNLGFPLVNNSMSFPTMCPRGAVKYSCDSVISVSVLGLRGGRNLDRLQRTYYQGGILAGEDEVSYVL